MLDILVEQEGCEMSLFLGDYVVFWLLSLPARTGWENGTLGQRPETLCSAVIPTSSTIIHPNIQLFIDSA